MASLNGTQKFTFAAGKVIKLAVFNRTMQNAFGFYSSIYWGQFQHLCLLKLWIFLSYKTWYLCQIENDTLFHYGQNALLLAVAHTFRPFKKNECRKRNFSLKSFGGDFACMHGAFKIIRINV